MNLLIRSSVLKSLLIYHLKSKVGHFDFSGDNNLAGPPPVMKVPGRSEGF